ncbi:hypothetical protein OG592_37310 [Streptomyces avidinii]|uniref:hypothetical protein n=1 Tax=Streptomyces avidinii TaxID=1895 RepID=UPI00386C25A2|nr:hypothetical protein OG592_37310 [Streptomyces avidinii]
MSSNVAGFLIVLILTVVGWGLVFLVAHRQTAGKPRSGGSLDSGAGDAGGGADGCGSGGGGYDD